MTDEKLICPKCGNDKWYGGRGPVQSEYGVVMGSVWRCTNCKHETPTWSEGTDAAA